MGKRPGNLKQYAAHAGISRQAAAEQLKRVGIDYLQPFDFAEADKRRAAARHADREAFATPIYSPTADLRLESSRDHSPGIAAMPGTCQRAGLPPRRGPADNVGPDA